MLLDTSFRMLSRLATRILLMVGIAAILLLMVDVALDVVLRNTGQATLGGTLERTSYWWMIAMVAAGLAIAEDKNEHLRVTLLSRGTVTSRSGPYLALIRELLLLFMLCAFTFFAALEAIRSMGIEERAPASNVVIWPVRFLLTAGLGAYSLLIATSIIAILLSMRRATRRET